MKATICYKLKNPPLIKINKTNSQKCEGNCLTKKKKHRKKKNATTTTTQCEHNRHSGEGGANLFFGYHNVFSLIFSSILGENI